MSGREHRWAIAAVALAAVVNWRATGCYFLADDFLHLYQIANFHPLEFLITPNGGHLYVTRNAVFYATSMLFGPHPGPYYWSGFLIHLLNVWLLFRLIRLLTASALLASSGAALWGSSYSVAITLGWYATYGHELMVTALLLVLNQAVPYANGAEPPRRTRALWYALALAAATSFGVGIGVAMTLPLVLWLLGVRAGVGPRRSVPLVWLPLIVPVLYLVLNWAYETASGTQAFGEFDVGTVAREWTTVLRFLGDIVALGLTRLVLGYTFPRSLAVGVWYAVLGITAMILAGVVRGAEPGVRCQLAALVLLLLACYAPIAIGRSHILSRMSRDVLVGAGYYHYSGQLVLSLILCLMLSQLPALPDWASRTALAVWYGVVVLLWLRWAPPIGQHVSARRDTAAVLASIQAAIDAQPPSEAVYIENRVFAPVPLPLFMFPGWAGVFIIFHPDNVVDGRRVYFVERVPEIPPLLRRGRRTGELIISGRTGTGG